jgi:uncharacterized surface protein with fasciclin (FAS1) repeats
MMSRKTSSGLLKVLAIAGLGLFVQSSGAIAIPKSDVPAVPGSVPGLPMPGAGTPTMPVTPVPKMPKPDMPKAEMPKVEVPDGTKAETPKQNIVEVASGNASFKTLVAAVKAAGLVDVLSGEGPFTVFAPTDAAFEALPKGTLEALLKPENKEQLIKLLGYHVIPESTSATQLGKLKTIKTVQGDSLAIVTQKEGLTVGGAKVLMADVGASNGMIHAIDHVLIPPDASKLAPSAVEMPKKPEKSMVKKPVKAPITAPEPAPVR